MSKSRSDLSIYSVTRWGRVKPIWCLLIIAVMISVNASAQVPPGSYTLFQPSDSPVELSNNDASGGIEVGVKFQVSQSGTIDKIRFYKGQTTSVSYTVHLWGPPNVTEPIATSAVYTTSTVGWHEVAITPVTVQVGVTYIASVYNPSSYYSATSQYFAVAKQSGPITAPAYTTDDRNGVYKYGVSGRPTSGSTSKPNYWVDIVFTPVSAGVRTFNGTANYVAKFSDPITIGNSIIYDNGTSVGIGTTNIAVADPAYKLFVDLGIRTRKVKVDIENWPDYVFDKKYHLPSLSEVEKYIQQHKHLPEISSAAEIEKEGLDVGDSQAMLLKKIEELTLYLIEQNKANEQMKIRISELEEKIQKLSGAANK